MHMASAWEVRGRCVRGACEVSGRCMVLGRLVVTEGHGGQRRSGLQVGVHVRCMPAQERDAWGWLYSGGRGARGHARDDAWERLCTCTCDTLCERPSGMPFICVVIGLHVGQGSPR